MQASHFAQLVALSALWGSSFLFLRVSSPVIGPMVVTGARMALTTLTLALLMVWLRQPWPWRQWRPLLVLGLMAVALPFSLNSWAALNLPAGYSALLNTTAVLFSTLSAAWLKEDTLSLRKLLSFVVGFLGVGLIVRIGPVQPDAATLAAAVACVAAAAVYGASAPLMKHATQTMSPLAIATGIHVVATLFTLPGALWALPDAGFSMPALVSLLVMGVVTSGLVYWAHLRIIRHISPVASMSPVFMIPVFGVTWGHLFLGEALSPGIFAGGALVLLASALVTGFNPLRRTPLTAPPP